MLTTTHVTLNALLARLAASGRSGPFATATAALLPDRGTRVAIIVGGLAPDVGLTLLSVGAAVWFPTVEGLTRQETFSHVYRELFFEDPVWIAVHNVLHAPLVLGPAIAVAAAGVRRGRRWGRVLLAFAVGCLLHTGVDILTHVDDGPLLLWPFDSSTRFHSPVSYYDPRHHGKVLGPIDTAITLLAGGWLLGTWTARRRAARTLT